MKTKSMLLAPFAVAILSYGAFAADLPRQRDVGYTAPPDQLQLGPATISAETLGTVGDEQKMTRR